MSGVILGRRNGDYLFARDQQFVLLAAPTGSDKTVAVVLPNMLNFGDSVVAFDLKMELHRFTSKFRAAHGQQVFLFAPFAEDQYTHRWNVLDTVARDPLFRVGDAMAVGQVFYPSDCDPREKFWNDSARNLFLAFVLYLMETPSLPCTMGEIFRQSSGKGKELKDHIQTLIADRKAGPTPLSNECRDAFARFLSSPENTLGNIISTFNAPLLPFANPIVDAATSASDFDISLVRQQRISIYIGIAPSKLADASLLVNVLFSRLIDLNTRELPEVNPALRYQCLLVLDEFTALGKINIIAKANSYIRGYNLRLLTIIQSVAQLEAVYGPSDTRTLITNHAIQIIFPPREQKDASAYSEMLGYLTEQVVSKGVSHSRGMGHSGSVSENTSAQRRALMLPQELKELPQHQQIILSPNLRPILCEKVRYYEDEQFLNRLRSMSPSLNTQAKSGLYGVLRTMGVCRRLARPSEQQLKHAAFVLRELSAPVPRLEVSQAAAVHSSSPEQAEAPPFGKAINLNALSLDVSVLPKFDDVGNPSPESVSKLVDAFFAQLEWTEPTGDPGSTQRDYQSEACPTADAICAPSAENLVEGIAASRSSKTVPKDSFPQPFRQLDLSLLDEPLNPPQPRNQL